MPALLDRSAPTPGALLRHPRAWAVFLGFWVVVVGSWVLIAAAVAPPASRRALVYGVSLDAASWVVLFVCGLGLAGAVPLDRPRRRRGVAVILAVAVALVLGRIFAVMYGTAGPPLPVLLTAALGQQLLTFLTFVAAGYAARHALAYRERQLALARSEAELARARFRTLRARLRPGFILKELDGVVSALHGDPVAADRRLQELSEVLRRTLRDATEGEAPLREEEDSVQPRPARPHPGGRGQRGTPGTLRLLMRDRLLRTALLAGSICFATTIAAADFVIRTVTASTVGIAGEVAATWFLMLLVIPALGAVSALTTDRFTLEEGRARDFLASGGVAVAAALALSLFSLGSRCYVLPLEECSSPGEFLLSFPVFLMFMPGLLGLATALRISARHGEQEIAEARMEVALADARFEALNAQLHPHFVFNSLQSVSTLMRREPGAAADVASRLGDLLRLALERESVHEVALVEELRFLELYTGIERVRFGDRLRLQVRADPGSHGAMVPRLLLQPLVENAIRHGIARRPGPGRVEVDARTTDGELHLAVRDDGPNVSAGASTPGRGIGLANARARLEALYGARQRLVVDRPPEGGVIVTITIPLRYAGAERVGEIADDSDTHR